MQLIRLQIQLTGDFYIGSSKDVASRWAAHKCPSRWKKCSNNPMYQDFQKYGVNKFEFQILAEVEPESLKEAEQKFIETLKPTYNINRANGWNIERNKELQKKYEKSYKRKEYKKKYRNQLCLYSSEILTLNALSKRFYRAGIEHCLLEAKKYLIK